MRIAFAGKMRSGKDSSYEYIKSKYPDTLNIKFADPIYIIQNFIYNICNFEPVQKDRDLLISVGTWARNKDKNIWINVLTNTINSLPKDQDIIVTDARFINELECLKKLGFILIKLEREEEKRKEFGATESFHPTETESDLYTDYDYIIQNNGTLEEFHSKLDTILNIKEEIGLYNI